MPASEGVPWLRDVEPNHGGGRINQIIARVTLTLTLTLALTLTPTLTLTLPLSRYPAHERGDALIFVSGVEEIERLISALQPYAASTGRCYTYCT